MTKHKIKFEEPKVEEYKPKFFGKSVIEGIEAVPINLPPNYYTKKFHEYESELKKYKDIEEELGIDLVTLFKSVFDGFYVKDENGITFVHKTDVKEKLMFFKESLFKDYGKTWALTKEELEVNE